jgi:proline iminopeptidase
VYELITAYLDLVSSLDADVRERAATSWCAWEDALIAHESAGRPGSYGQRVGRDRTAFVRLCAHYFGHRAWLRPGQLIADVGRLGHVPAELVHGYGDLSCPPETAWRLDRAWPSSRLQLVQDSGHTGTPAFADAIRTAIDGLAVRYRSGSG